MEMIDVGHTNCLVRVEIMWAEDPWTSCKSSWRSPTNALCISPRTIVP